jgi:hypothetical protein
MQRREQQKNRRVIFESLNRFTLNSLDRTQFYDTVPLPHANLEF